MRHPVSVARRRLGNAILVLMLSGFVYYGLTTRDEVIRRRAVTFIEEATPGGVEVSVGGATFSMFGGITLHDVRVSVPYSAALDPEARDPESRTIFSAASLRLIHNPWRLLLGRLRVQRVVAVRPTIILSYNTETGLRNWQLLSGGTEKQEVVKPGYRPIVTVREARVEIVSIDKDGTQQRRTEELDADVRPNLQAETGYFIDVRRYSDPVEQGTVLFDPGTRLVANTPFVDVKTIGLQLPPGVRHWFQKLDLKGEAKLSRLVYSEEAAGNLETDIELRDVRCQIPFETLRTDRDSGASVEARDGSDAVAGNLLRMTQVRGKLRLQPDRLTVDITAIVNGAACSVQGSLEQIDGELKQIGIDLAIKAERMRAPEGADREKMLASGQVPEGIKRFVRDYDPFGEFDLDLTVTRAEKQAASLRVAGCIRPLKAVGSARWFPYRIRDLEGVVEFDGDDVTIDLSGRHDSGDVTIEGHLDRRYAKSEISLDIRGSAVPLDKDLYEALPEHYRAAWRRFKPRGTADIHASLHRPGVDGDAPAPRLDKHIAIDLIDSQAWLSLYPRMLDHVSGRLEVEGDRIRIVGLTGDSDGASVRLDGDAIVTASRHPEVELRIEAKGVRLDDSFGSALPPEGRGAFAQFQPEGRVDILGTLSLHDPERGLVWDLRADVYDTRLLYELFPYSIEAVHGRIEIRPDTISILDVHGRHGEADIRARGTVRRRENGYSADLALIGDGLRLDYELYHALPDALKTVWNLLEPDGWVCVRTGLHFTSQDGQTVRKHRTEIEPINAALCFRAFPLPIAAVNGKVLVTGGRVEIASLTGEAGGGKLELSGEIDLSEPGRRGTLVVRAGEMRFDPALIEAMPDALRRVLESLVPRGRFDLRLDPLRFETDDHGRTHWEFDGCLTLDDVGARLGITLHHCTGTMTGQGAIDVDGRVSLEADAACKQAVLAGWQLQNIKARIRTDSAEKRILITDGNADLYGGEAMGFARIDLDEARSSYEASFTMHDLQLSRYLDLHRAKRADPEGGPGSTARGSVSGNFVLRGKTGRGGYREGFGEAFLSEAQVWKLPVFLAIFQVLNLTPDENVFHDGRLEFYLSGDTLTFHKIDLQGKAMSFIGGGTLDLRTDQLDVTLLAGSPVRVRVPLLTEIIEGASREIMEVRITGTLAKPNIRPQPLKSLGVVLKTLFPPAPAPTRKGPPSRDRK
ncbi:MAG: AsmA-like C-terminal domain-containing protein [Phycisphaerae bacterium]